mgnify:CR=1 FL=1
MVSGLRSVENLLLVTLAISGADEEDEVSVLFAACFRCKDIIDYAIHGDMTTFPRGEWLAHQDSIITGFKTKETAEKCLQDDPYKMKKETP